MYRQAVLKEAFEGKFTKLKHEKISIDIENCTKEETKNLPEIPSEWKYVHLNKLGDLGRGKSKHRPRNDARLLNILRCMVNLVWHKVNYGRKELFV